jgi:hypothetical protein
MLQRFFSPLLEANALEPRRAGRNIVRNEISDGSGAIRDFRCVEERLQKTRKKVVLGNGSQAGWPF